MINIDTVLKQLETFKQQQFNGIIQEDIWTYSAQAINKISILYPVIHQRASVNDDNKVIEASTFGQAQVLREISQYFHNNPHLIPHDYSLVLGPGDTVNGTGDSVDLNFEHRTEQIIKFNVFEQQLMVMLIATIHRQMHTICLKAMNNPD